MLPGAPRRQLTHFARFRSLFAPTPGLILSQHEAPANQVLPDAARQHKARVGRPGGGVEVRSAAGKGTRFTLPFP